MAQSGEGIFFDGKSSARHLVTVEVGPVALLVRSSEGLLLAQWPYQELEQTSSPGGVLRITRAGSKILERVEVRDPQLASAIDDLSLPVDRSGATERRSRRKVVFWSVVAVVSLLLVGVYGVPEIASRLAPYVPYPLERRLGDVVETQVRSMLDPGQQGQSFECGWTEPEKAGRAALNQLVGRLETAAALPIPLRLVVVRKKEANALALPGGHIYIFEGLITRANSPDEVAGVIAHEIGHVAHRDGTRSVLQAAGLSFLFGLVLGDFVGGGAVILAGKTILQLAYSREVEGDADRYALDLMAKAGGDGRALGTMLERISGAIEPGTKILLDHPATKERVVLINAAAGPTPNAPMLDAAGWAALRRICAGS